MVGFFRREKVAEALEALKGLSEDPEEHRVNADSRAEDLSVDQFVELYRRLGPPPGVTAKKDARSEEDFEEAEGPEEDGDAAGEEEEE